MKKLKLQTLGLSVNELLSREQLKKVMGGSGGGSGASNVYCCTCSNSNNQPSGSAWTYTSSSGVPQSAGFSDVRSYCANTGYCSTEASRCPLG